MTAKRRTQALVTAVATGLAVALGIAGLAWACTAQPTFSVNPVGGTAGSQVFITGEAVSPQGLVEIRWNGVSGTKIAQTVADGGGSFAVAATIPDVAPGVYSVVAVAGNDGVARSAFEVTSPAPSPTATDSTAGKWSGSEPTSLVSPTPGSSGPLAAGVALLAAGLVTLFSGFAVASVRRRRALAITDR